MTYLIYLPHNLFSFPNEDTECIQVWFGFLFQHFQFVFLAAFAQEMVVKEDERCVTTVMGCLQLTLEK